MPIFFDIEFYVPLQDRKKTISLKANPNQRGHFVLGGVFYQGSLYNRPKQLKFEEVWIWDEPYFDRFHHFEEFEKGVLEKIYELFQKENQRLQNLPKSQQSSFYTIGTGIARFDLPVLYIRSVEQDIASTEDLFSTYLAGFPIDLSNVGIGFMNKKKGTTLRPVTSRKLIEKFNIEGSKEGGSKVWEYYDDGLFHEIENRTRQEVKNDILLYHKMRKKMNKY